MGAQDLHYLLHAGGVRIPRTAVDSMLGEMGTWAVDKDDFKAFMRLVKRLEEDPLKYHLPTRVKRSLSGLKARSQDTVEHLLHSSLHWLSVKRGHRYAVEVSRERPPTRCSTRQNPHLRMESDHERSPSPLGVLMPPTVCQVRMGSTSSKHEHPIDHFPKHPHALPKLVGLRSRRYQGKLVTPTARRTPRINEIWSPDFWSPAESPVSEEGPWTPTKRRPSPHTSTFSSLWSPLGSPLSDKGHWVPLKRRCSQSSCASQASTMTARSQVSARSQASSIDMPWSPATSQQSRTPTKTPPSRIDPAC